MSVGGGEGVRRREGKEQEEGREGELIGELIGVEKGGRSEKRCGMGWGERGRGHG